MVNQGRETAAQLAAKLKAFTERNNVTFTRGGRAVTGGPSQRALSELMGIPRSTIGDFLRNPGGRSAATVAQIYNAMTSARMQFQSAPGAVNRVTYMDAPLWNRESIANMRPPRSSDGSPSPGARYVVATSEATYNGFRSTEWIADTDRLAELGASVPGGYVNIERIVFDTGA